MQSERKKWNYGGGVGFVKQVGLCREWKREEVMDAQSGESEEEEVTGEGIGESEMEEVILSISSRYKDNEGR